jgi:cation diffusion facilitator CzcD-associated flavoprotein CzcO
VPGGRLSVVSTPRGLIIGTGFAGLAMAVRLHRAGIHSFTLLEKADRLGGTWRENTYPGAACDLMSFAYCFSFEQKTDWSRKWSPQPEILAYMEHCAEKWGLLPKIRFGTTVLGARFDAFAGVWRVRARRGDAIEELEAEVLVSGVGQLHRPVVPKIPGLESFEGDWFHSAQWKPDVDLAGRRVGVVGNAASAIQFVPEIAPEVSQLTIFQRSANWIIPRGDRAYTEGEKRRFGRFPWLAKAYRWLIWARQELMFQVMVGTPFFSKRFERAARQNIEDHVGDPELRRVLVPDYPIGGKRILIHDDYYPALARENVSLVTAPIDHADPEGLVTADGDSHPFDVLIFATGFDTNSFLAPMAIEGLGGRLLEDAWKGGAEAYLGMTVPGFPNFFMMYGPNTNLGHNSIIFMLECQADYIAQCVEHLGRRGLRYLDLRPDAMRAFNERLQRDLSRTMWARTGKSWYKTADGRITNNWSGTTTRYWWETRRPDFGAYEQALADPPRAARG